MFDELSLEFQLRPVLTQTIHDHDRLMGALWPVRVKWFDSLRIGCFINHRSAVCSFNFWGWNFLENKTFHAFEWSHLRGIQINFTEKEVLLDKKKRDFWLNWWCADDLSEWVKEKQIASLFSSLSSNYATLSGKNASVDAAGENCVAKCVGNQMSASQIYIFS